MKIQLFGAGHVGANIANALLHNRLCDVLWITDVNDKKLMGEYEDLLDAKFILDSKMEIKPIKVPVITPKEVDIYIITAGFPRKNGMKPMPIQLKRRNKIIVWSLVKDIPKDAEIWVATNPVKEICELLRKNTYKNVISLGDMLDRARIKRTMKGAEETANFIVTNKGYSSHGVTAEVVTRLRNKKMVKNSRKLFGSD